MRVSIGFSRPKKWYMPYGWFIRKIENTKYNHVFIGFKNHKKERFIFDASEGTIDFRDPREFFSDTTVIESYSVFLSPKQTYQFDKFIKKHQGKKYAWWQVVGLVWVKIFGGDNPIQSGSKRQICSETVALFLRDVCGYRLPFDIDTVTPKMLNKFMKSRTKLRRIK